MIRRKTLILIAASVLMVSASAATIGFEDDEELNSESAVDVEVTQGDSEQETFFSSLSTFMLSAFYGVQDKYEPSETVDITVGTTYVEDIYDTEGLERVTKVYKCADSSCETPPSDWSGEDCSVEQYWPEGDDCVAKDVNILTHSSTRSAGQTWTWNVDFSGFQDEAHYAVITAVWDNGQVVTETPAPKEIFEVVESDDDDDNGGWWDDPDPGPEINDYRTPDIDVDHETGEIEGTVYIENEGDDMEENHIVEMQVKTNDDNFLSIFVGSQGTCDPDHPENVHREYRLDNGERESITLETQIDPDGEEYDIVFLTATDCMIGGDGEFTQPYEGSSDEYRFSNVQVGHDNADLQAYRTPEISGNHDEGDIRGTVYIENTGGDMEEPAIVEMQILDDRGGFLSTFVGRQGTCDPDHPENVHREFQLESGESAEIDLSTSITPDGEEYDIVFYTVTDCMVDGDGEFIEPYAGYGNGFRFDGIQIGDDEPELVENREPELDINHETGEVEGTVFFENEGGSMPEDYIVEMQIKTPQNQFLSAFVGSQSTCDPEHSENVYRPFNLESGGSESITLSSKVPELGEAYDVVFLTASDCMVDGDGVFVDPYGGRLDEYRFTEIEIGDEDAPPPTSGEGISIIPLTLIAVGAGLMAVIGYRRL